MKQDVLDTNGKKIDQITLPKEIFGVKINPHLLAQAVRVYLSNQRKAYPKTKTRSDVKTSHRKIWRQKGTGRARHGSKNAPIFVGGAVAHGPRGNQNYQKNFPKKMRRTALFCALASKLKEKKIVVVEGLQNIKPKTKEAATVLKNLKLDSIKLLIVLPQKIQALTRSTKNIPQVSTLTVAHLNPYQVLNNHTLLFTKESLEKLKENFLVKKKTRSKSK